MLFLVSASRATIITGSSKALRTNIAIVLNTTSIKLIWTVVNVSRPRHCPVSKATCRSTIRSARGLVADIGEDLAKKSPGLVELAHCSEKNSERDTHNLLDKYGLSLPIPMTKLEVSTDEIDMQILRLRDWMGYILENNAFHIMCGLMKPHPAREDAILESFWKKFKHEHPDHPIYGMAERNELLLKRTVPVVCHGDEGRGAKRQAYLVTHFHSLLGRGTNPQKRRDQGSKLKIPFVKHELNFRGHSYSNRFLFGCLPKHWYTHDKDHVFTDLMTAAAREALFMSTTGVTDPFSGKTYWCMMLGMVGDWPWLAKSGGLNRTFNHVQKRTNVRNPPAGICHLCQAGQDHVAYEEINTRRPAWLNTVNVQSPFGQPSAFEVVPHPPGKLAEMWKYDAFHCFHLGVGRQFLGSYLALLSEFHEGGNIDERFNSLSADYMSWCKTNKRNTHVKRLTKELISWPKTTVYPVGAWSKGDLTTTLMEYVEDRYKDEAFTDNPLLQKSREATSAVNMFFRLIFSRGLFLNRDDASLAANLALQFLRRYSFLAETALRQSRALYILQPKCHAFHHIAISMYLSSSTPQVRYILNPLGYSTQCDEDFVGRPSRLARRTKVGKVQVRRVLQRYLKGAYHQWIKLGFIRRKAR